MTNERIKNLRNIFSETLSISFTELYTSLILVSTILPAVLICNCFKSLAVMQTYCQCLFMEKLNDEIYGSQGRLVFQFLIIHSQNIRFLGLASLLNLLP